MQYIQKNPPTERKTLGLGWKGVVFAVLVVVLSLVISIVAVDLVTAAIAL